jgi:hypothetical protein
MARETGVHDACSGTAGTFAVISMVAALALPSGAAAGSPLGAQPTRRVISSSGTQDGPVEAG